ncbi:nitroreductase family protein [Stutzerimonas tarimensis]|uniref:Putative NAD(P)H nitroreductase n=1 Tax=Stutzerimonas tarimensis TaxID=1507735 RepID=A0ABV7TDW5_9GAMM
MEALELLLGRVSVSRLGEPAPDTAQLETLFKAAFRAPDHGQLRPWRFLTVQGDARERLGELLAEAVGRQPEAKSEAEAKARKMPLRAPLVVIAIGCPQVHAKIPPGEQLLTVGCAVHGMLLAAQAIGLGGIWRTGPLAYDVHVAAGLGLAEHEQILGFLYLGTPEGALRTPPVVEVADFVRAWP